MLRPISTQEKFPKISLLKVENFQLQNFFPTENLCRPITFYKIFFLRKIFLSGNGPLDSQRQITAKIGVSKVKRYPRKNNQQNNSKKVIGCSKWSERKTVAVSTVVLEFLCP
jgi:hypothetical protein